LGWHTHYLGFDEEQFKGWSPETLVSWSPAMFASEYLVERISGIGLARDVPLSRTD
jgi:hypothetical protein